MINILKQWYERYFTDPQTVIFAFILIFGFLLIVVMNAHLMPILIGIIIAYLFEGLVVRMDATLVRIDKLLQKQGPVGRRLDFLVQEMMREVNTIGSKCNDAPVAHAVVELKTFIERLREQVQNIE